MVLLSTVGVGIWLYFVVVEKSLIGKASSGHLLMVDLVVGLPLVLMFTVMVYACIYWLCKSAIILWFPQMMIPLTPVKGIKNSSPHSGSSGEHSS